MRFIIAAALIAATTAHADVTRHDGPITPTRSDTTMLVTIVSSSPTAIRRKCAEMGAYSSPASPGCARVDTVEKTCTVYVTLPETMADTRRFALLGHEVLHCFLGRYHSEPSGLVPQ